MTKAFWRQVLDAFLHRGPGYQPPTTAGRYAEARIGFALVHCALIEDQLRGKDTVTVTEALDAVRCIRGALDPDSAR